MKKEILRRNKKVPAVFLDKDGTLTSNHHLVWRENQIRVRPDAVKLIKFLNRNKIPVVVITNQATVARGLVTESGVRGMHRFINEVIKKEGARINAFYFCPHHSEATLKKYRRNCDCRKPGVGLFKKAAKDLNLDLKNSIMIGDMTWDILAGNRLKMKTILLLQGFRGEDGRYHAKPDFKVKTLRSALPIIKKYLCKQ